MLSSPYLPSTPSPAPAPPEGSAVIKVATPKSLWAFSAYTLVTSPLGRQEPVASGMWMKVGKIHLHREDGARGTTRPEQADRCTQLVQETLLCPR